MSLFKCFPFPLCLLTAPEEEPVRYRVETLALFVLGPVVVLALLSVVSVLACRRLHHGRLQRLQEFDTEQGAIDGLITSNVGDSTLAVRIREVLLETMKRGSISHILFTPSPNSVYTRISKLFSPPRLCFEKQLCHLCQLLFMCISVQL